MADLVSSQLVSVDEGRPSGRQDSSAPGRLFSRSDENDYWAAPDLPALEGNARQSVPRILSSWAASGSILILSEAARSASNSFSGPSRLTLRRAKYLAAQALRGASEFVKVSWRMPSADTRAWITLANSL
jgi:hypothetical protein